MKTVLVLVGILHAVAMSCYCAEPPSVKSTPPATIQRMNKEQLLAALPKSLGAYQQQNIGVYQPMADYNRLERSYTDTRKKNLDVEVRDTGGFTKEFIQSNFYLRGKVGEKQFDCEILLLEGNRCQMYESAFGDGKIVKMVWHDRYEIQLTSKSEDYDILKKFILEVAAHLK